MQEEMRRRTREAPKAPDIVLGWHMSTIMKDREPSENKEQKFWWETCWTPCMPPDADEVSCQAYYSEEGKALCMGKDLTEVRSLHRKLVPDNAGLGQYEPTSMQGNQCDS